MQTMTKRFEWMDTARGTAIVLVILNHAYLVPIEKGVPVDEALVPYFDAFALFRIPLLLFLSGCLLPRSISKPTGDYWRGKLSFIAWPYLIWVIIRHIPEAGEIPPWDPEVWWSAGYLWFLSYLMIYYAAAWVFYKLTIPYWAGAVIGFAMACLPLGEASQVGFNAIFFFVGAMLWSARPGLDFVSRPAVWATGIVAAGLGVAAQVQFDLLVHFPALAFASIGGIFAILAFFRVAGSWTRPLQYIGRNSLVFYVTHFPAISAGTAILAVIAMPYVDWFWLVLLIGGTAVGYGFCAVRHVRPFKWLFEAPRFHPRP